MAGVQRQKYALSSQDHDFSISVLFKQDSLKKEQHQEVQDHKGFFQRRNVHMGNEMAFDAYAFGLRRYQR